jgi:hypothetical protein
LIPSLEACRICVSTNTKFHCSLIMHRAYNKSFQNSFPGHLILSNNGLSGSITTEFNQMGLLEILLLDGNNLVGDINEVLSGTNNLGKLQHSVDSRFLPSCGNQSQISISHFQSPS